VVSEAYVLGVSTRKVEDLVEAMGAKGMSKSEVSRMAGELDAQVAAFKNRPLSGVFPYVWLDAVYIKVRERMRVVCKAVLVAYGVSEQGERQVLGVEVADSEMEMAWRRFLEGLIARGLRGTQLVISDAHSGLKAAIRAVLNGTSWQRCRVHFLRNALAKAPKNSEVHRPIPSSASPVL
jgi:putative transposase